MGTATRCFKYGLLMQLINYKKMFSAGHKKVKLFITQGGIQSLEETLHSHVPIVGIPFFGDQFANVKRIVNKGCGLLIDYKNLNKDEFKKIIVEVIENEK